MISLPKRKEKTLITLLFGYFQTIRTHCIMLHIFLQTLIKIERAFREMQTAINFRF